MRCVTVSHKPRVRRHIETQVLHDQLKNVVTFAWKTEQISSHTKQLFKHDLFTAVSALTLMPGQQEGHLACKKI